MPTNNESKMSNYFDLPNPGLRSYLGRVVEGQPDEYRTTFYKGKSPSQVVSSWMSYLESNLQEWPTLLQFEKDLASKVGPMSIMKPLSERLVDIDHYYEDIHLSSKPIHSSALKAVVSEWGSNRGIEPRGEVSTVEVMKKSTSSGNPFFVKRKGVTSKTLPCEVLQLPNGEYLQQLGPHKSEWLTTAILGWRGQEGGPSTEDVKQRVVWMFPFGVNIKELQMYQPLIEVGQRINWCPAWVSMEAVDQRITAMFDTKNAEDLVVCTDFSKFDQHFNSKLQDGAQSIIRRLASPKAESWLQNIFPIKYDIPLCYDWGKIRYGAHGMASGSGGTNVDETLVHRALQFEAAILSGKRLNPNSQCLGDDGILTYPGITVEDVIRSYTAHGLEMNESKQYASTQDCTYLRRWHHADYRMNGVCVGVYATCRALGRLCEQERYYDPEEWGREMVALRQLSIMENCKFHPLREQFADYCMKGDKFRLGLDIPGFFDSIASIAKKAIDNMPDFIGYTKSIQKAAPDAGIENWWIVQYLKSKA